MQESYADISHSPLSKEYLDAVLAMIAEGIRGGMGKEEFGRQKARLAKDFCIGHVPGDIEILTYLSKEQLEAAKPLLMTKPVRTGSGVTVVAVMTKPLPCPHGKCTYCPGGPGSYFGDVPQSYTGNEPASMRGRRANYDIYTQIFNRLEQYIVSGHNPEKVELILMGGTFTSYDRAYQDEVVHDIYQAMDDFSGMFYKECGRRGDGSGEGFDFEAFKEFYELPGSIHDKERTARLQEKILKAKLASQRCTQSISALQLENERVAIRCIGFTIETRPSHARLKEANLMLEQGCTRVELGVQTTFDDALAKVHRDHTVQESIDAIATLRDLGFKLNFHIMLGLPLMTPERDLEAARRLFDDPAFRPDMLKLYPCMVMPGTALYYDFKAGRYAPYSTQTAAEVIAEVKRIVPRYVRIMRVQRDIPTKVTAAGVGMTNLRQVVQETCNAKGVVCRCIRCREVRGRQVSDATLNIMEYEASGGREFFISFDDPKTDACLGFCRLRFPARQLRSEIIASSAIIRELHVYGTATGLGEEAGENRVQHKGLGTRLVDAAEQIAAEHGKAKVLVISGVGVRGYYAKLGYSHDGPYMSKML
jgi:elongator complex protein 3